MTRRESTSYSLYGDLEGMSVASLRELISDLPDDAVIDVREESVRGFGDGDGHESEYFVFVWDEDDG
jgi:hypothetical protein